MVDSTFNEPNPSCPLAIGYDIFGRPLPFFHYQTPSAAGLVTNLKDLTRFVQFHFDPLKLSSIFTLSQFEKSTSPNENNYGFGYEVRMIDKEKLIYHVGTNRGWNSLIACFPANRKGIVILTNSDYGHHFFYHLADHWVRDITGYPFPDMEENWAAQKTLSFYMYILGSVGGILLIYFLLDLIRNHNMFRWKYPSWHLFLLFNSPFLLFLFIFYTPWGFLPGWVLAAYTPWGWSFLSYEVAVISLLINFRLVYRKIK
jgi:hypothetical protein